MISILRYDKLICTVVILILLSINVAIPNLSDSFVQRSEPIDKSCT